MRRVAALVLVVVLFLSWGSYKQQSAPLNVTCATVTGGTQWTAKGVTWMRELGEWVREFGENPPDANELQHTIYGVAHDVMWFWFRALVQSGRGVKVDPEILKLERDAATAGADAENQCKPCPTEEPTDPPQDGGGDPRASLVNPVVASNSGSYDPQVVKVAIARGKAAKLPSRAWVVALAAGSQESGLRNLNYGHSSSVGVWQLIDTHGTVAQRTNVAWSADWFYRQLKGVAGWQSLSINDAAQAVERSGHPTLYADDEPLARQLVQQYGDVPPGDSAEPAPTPQCVSAEAGKSGTVMATVAGTRTLVEPTSGTTYQVPIPAGPRGVAINFALDQVEDKDPYVWAAHGPDAWDCSGLVAGAWAKAGVTFTPQTEVMLGELPRVDKAQPGDLLYHPGHVQMYLGKIGGQTLIVEAPRTGSLMRVRPQWMTPTAILDPTRKGQPA